MAPRGLGHSPAVRRGRMVQPRALLLCLSSLALVVAFVVVSRMADANGGDLPPEIRLQGFVRAEEGRLHLVVRIPLILLQGLDLPKWGPGYLQLAGIDERLMAAAAAAARDIVLFEGGRPLAPIRSETQISLPSDRSFDGYATALRHVQGPRLPVDTKVFWNQGYFDAHIEYPIRSGADFALHLKMSPGLGQRVKLRVQFLPMSGPSLTYDLSGGDGRISLDPRWYEVAWIFARRGFSDVFVVDRLVFLVCLVTPFRQFWSLLMVVLALTGMQAVTSICGRGRRRARGQMAADALRELSRRRGRAPRGGERRCAESAPSLVRRRRRRRSRRLRPRTSLGGAAAICRRPH